MANKNGVIYVSRSSLIGGLAATLRNYENEEVVLVSGGSSCDDGTTLETFDIYVGKNQIFHDTHIHSQQYRGCVEDQDLITLASAYDLIEPLYDKYPYLEPIMNRVSYDMFLNDSKSIGEKMIDAAVWYETYAPYTADILTFLKTRRN